VLPDFPKAKAEISHRLTLFLRKRALIQRGAALSDIAGVIIHEGNSNRILGSDGDERVTKTREASAESIVKADEVPEMSFQQVLQRLDQIAASIGQQQAKHFFEEIGDAVDRVGNTVDAQGQPFSIEKYFEMLERVQIEFNEDGTARMPTLVTGPALEPKIKVVLDELHNNPKHRKRFSEIMMQKKEEWRAREADRNLVG
jgi:hypothetical protein